MKTNLLHVIKPLKGFLLKRKSTLPKLDFVQNKTWYNSNYEQNNLDNNPMAIISRKYAKFYFEINLNFK